MTRAAALLLLAALVAAGCAEPDAAGRTVPLDVPAARALVPQPEDLPPGWRLMREEPQTWRAEGFLDGHGVEAWNDSADRTGRSQLNVLALRFETSAHAAASFASTAREIQGNVTNGTWGDESLVFTSDGPWAGHTFHLVRKGPVVWLVQRSEDRGGGDAPLDTAALIERLVARAS